VIKFNIPYVSGNEIERIGEAIANKSFSGNNHFSKLCEAYLEEKYGFNKCYLTPSCTAALEMAALIFELEPGDEIIVPSFTFASCPNPFLIGGVKVVLADCDKTFPNISVRSIEGLITPKTKAIMVMHYGGIACDLNSVMAICKVHGLFLIEDAAQCLNAFYAGKPLGSFGDIGVFSFHETKNIHCGEGGMIAVNNPALVDKAEIVRQYGTNRSVFLKGQVSHYESVGLGLAMFQSELNASFLYEQLKHISIVTDKRKALWNYYYHSLNHNRFFQYFTLPEVEEINDSNYHVFFILLNDAQQTNSLIDYLSKQNVMITKHFYPLHLSDSFKESSLIDLTFPNATFYNNSLVRLPLYYSLTNKDIDIIVEQLESFFLKRV